MTTNEILQQEDRTVNILTPDDFPQCEDVEEDGETFEANAIKKALYISKCSGLTAIADDSGIEVDALDGAPGVYSARYAGEPADDMANNGTIGKTMSGTFGSRRQSVLR